MCFELWEEDYLLRELNCETNIKGIRLYRQMT